MKRVHLVCNAHIDPVWQWDFDEGAAAALATFRSAADLAGEFDYIFCHNEALLYRYVEEYDPALFERIRELIAAGKWHIMGGWYLQPDCNMPCGESIVRQIQTGLNYFAEKFGSRPTTAVNFDPFGHSRGLAQIIKKCGQDSYLICRPSVSDFDPPLEDRQFLWQGFDGSEIKVYLSNFYVSQLGQAAEKVSREARNEPHDVICVLWGVGNHGGGPSRKDLADIAQVMKNSEAQIFHSTPENFFAEIRPEYTYGYSLWTCMPGCYTTMSAVKNKHMQLENELYLTEKMCSAAALAGLLDYPQKELDASALDLLNVEFHDILPGTSVRTVEEKALNFIGHGLSTLQKLKTRAFFALAAGEKPAQPGEYPVVVYNPHPYEYTANIACELMVERNDGLEEWTHVSVAGADGQALPSQTVKEEGNVNLDWRKKVVFEGRLKPFGITRFSVYTKREPYTPPPSREGLVFENSNKYVEIDAETGLLKKYRVGGREYIKEGFLPVLYDDNEDPWAMAQVCSRTGMGTNRRPFEPARSPRGIFSGLKQVRTTEDGDICLCVESLFEKDDTKLRIGYTIYKNNPAVDVEVTVFWNEKNRMLKLEIPVCAPGETIGQEAYGTETLYDDGRECVSQRFIAVKTGGGECLAVFKNCCYGSSYRGGTLSLSLLRGPCYSAHPIGSRPIVPQDRFVDRIDQGERHFAFRVTVCAAGELERLAQEYSQKIYALNIFPAGSGAKAGFTLCVDNRDIVLTVMKKCETREGYLLRLVNNSAQPAGAKIGINGETIALRFGRYEVKTVLFGAGKAEEISEMIV